MSVIVVAAALISVVAAVGAWWMSASGAGPPTRAAWVRNADKACADSVAQVNQIPPYDGTVDSLLQAMPQLLTIEETQLSAMKSVPAAPDDVPLVQGLYAASDDEISAGRDAYAELKVGNVTNFRVAFARASADDDAEQRAFNTLGTTCHAVPQN